MPFIRCFVALIVALIAILVIFKIPYVYLSPRWFFTACGVAFLAAAFVGFILPDTKKGDKS